MYIGITGQIGSGKTTATKIIASFGAAVIDADRIGRQVVDRSPTLLKRLVRQFGPEILTPSGRLSRHRLARLAFADEAAKRQLDHIVHPYLLKELRRQMRQKASRYDVVVIDAALLLDWELDREVDWVLVIHASRETRLGRLLERGLTRLDALARMRSQLPFREYQKRADRVILNNTTPEKLEPRLRHFYRKILHMKH
ncbi:MAG: dephospho-CoA kinase [bacterium]